MSPNTTTKALTLALGLSALLTTGTDAREDKTQGFLTPPSGYTLYLAWEDHSSLAFNEATGEWIAFDPGTPSGQGHGWHLSKYLYTTAR